MGQQQLLLLVLGIVIVGLAVVVGLQAFEKNQHSVTADQLVQDLVRTGSAVQAWSLMPEPMGGGGGDFHKGTTLVTFEDLTLAQDADGDHATPNGEIRFGTSTAAIVRLVGVNDAEQIRALYIACGIGPGDVHTEIVDYDNDSVQLACDGSVG